MTQIIKEDNLPMKKMTCDYCGCEFEYDKRDVRKEPGMPDFHGGIMPLSFCRGGHYFYSVTCPHCHTEQSPPSDILDQLNAENHRKDFIEDVRALARQYNIEIKQIEIKE